MTSASAPYFFMSYSREDVNLQQRIIAELRGRGINIWVDTENLILVLLHGNDMRRLTDNSYRLPTQMMKIKFQIYTSENRIGKVARTYASIYGVSLNYEYTPAKFGLLKFVDSCNC